MLPIPLLIKAGQLLMGAGKFLLPTLVGSAGLAAADRVLDYLNPPKGNKVNKYTDDEKQEIINLAKQLNGKNTTQNDVYKLFMGSSGDYFKRALGSAASNTLRAASKVIGTEAANSLASALLAGARRQNAAQESTYGPSRYEQIVHQFANGLLGTGNRNSAVIDAGANTLEDTLETYKQRNDAGRAAAAAALLNSQGNAPGALYDWLNGMGSRAHKVRNSISGHASPSRGGKK